MPKMKTHSGTKKRVKQTGSGKLMHEQVNKRHRLEVKSSTEGLPGACQHNRMYITIALKSSKRLTELCQ